MKRQCVEDLWGNESAPYNTIMTDMCHCSFVQTHRATVSEPSGQLLSVGVRDASVYIHQLQHRHHWEGKGALITGEASPAVLVAKKPPANAGDVKARV